MSRNKITRDLHSRKYRQRKVPDKKKLLGPPNDVAEWLRDQGAVESVKYDEDTGEPYRCFSINLTREE